MPATVDALFPPTTDQNVLTVLSVAFAANHDPIIRALCEIAIIHHRIVAIRNHYESIAEQIRHITFKSVQLTPLVTFYAALEEKMNDPDLPAVSRTRSHLTYLIENTYNQTTGNTEHDETPPTPTKWTSPRASFNHSFENIMQAWRMNRDSLAAQAIPILMEAHVLPSKNKLSAYTPEEQRSVEQLANGMYGSLDEARQALQIRIQNPAFNFDTIKENVIQAKNHTKEEINKFTDEIMRLKKQTAQIDALYAALQQQKEAHQANIRAFLAILFNRDKAIRTLYAFLTPEQSEDFEKQSEYILNINLPITHVDMSTQNTLAHFMACLLTRATSVADRVQLGMSLCYLIRHTGTLDVKNKANESVFSYLNAHTSANKISIEHQIVSQQARLYQQIHDHARSHAPHHTEAEVAAAFAAISAHHRLWLEVLLGSSIPSEINHALLQAEADYLTCFTQREVTVLQLQLLTAWYNIIEKGIRDNDSTSMQVEDASLIPIPLPMIDKPIYLSNFLRAVLIEKRTELLEAAILHFESHLTRLTPRPLAKKRAQEQLLKAIEDLQTLPILTVDKDHPIAEDKTLPDISQLLATEKARIQQLLADEAIIEKTMLTALMRLTGAYEVAATEEHKKRCDLLKRYAALHHPNLPKASLDDPTSPFMQTLYPVRVPITATDPKTGDTLLHAAIRAAIQYHDLTIVVICCLYDDGTAWDIHNNAHQKPMDLVPRKWRTILYVTKTDKGLVAEKLSLPQYIARCIKEGSALQQVMSYFLDQDRALLQVAAQKRAPFGHRLAIAPVIKKLLDENAQLQMTLATAMRDRNDDALLDQVCTLLNTKPICLFLSEIDAARHKIRNELIEWCTQRSILGFSTRGCSQEALAVHDQHINTRTLIETLQTATDAASVVYPHATVAAAGSPSAASSGAAAEPIAPTATPTPTASM